MSDLKMVMNGGLKGGKPECSSYGICHYSEFNLITITTIVTHLADGVSMVCASSESSHSDTGHQTHESRIDLWTFRNINRMLPSIKIFWDIPLVR
jgi:hypothetical protein